MTPNRFSAALEKHRAAGRELLDLTASNPTTCGFRYDDEKILRALTSPLAMQYHPEAKGLAWARVAVSQYYRERSPSKKSVSPLQLLLTTSTSEGYSFVFRLLCNPGDEVLVPAPSYPLFEFLADIQDVKLAPYCLLYDHGWQIDLHSVKEAVSERTCAIIVVNPNNPTGSYVKPQELDVLNDLCAAHGLALIADEVFLDYSHSGVQQPSFAENKKALTFTLSGISKISALPQMKVAWIAVSGPEALTAPAMSRLEVIADTYLSMNAPVQLALPTLLEERRTIQPQVQSRVRTNLEELDKQLSAQQVCSRLEIEGGWYAVVRVPATRSDEELAIELLEKRSVLVHPGHFYDFSGDGYLILSLITPEAEFREGISRVLTF